MKNKILLSLLMIIGSMQTLNTAPYSDDDNYFNSTHVNYDREYDHDDDDDQIIFIPDNYYDADDITMCQSILDNDIEMLKSWIIPGEEISFIRRLSPNIDLDYYYLVNDNFIHFLVYKLNKDTVATLKTSFAIADINLYTSKILDLIKYAVAIGVNVDPENYGAYNIAERAILYGAFDAAILLIQLGADVNMHCEVLLRKHQLEM